MERRISLWVSLPFSLFVIHTKEFYRQERQALKKHFPGVPGE
jgi:hypothetical protein